MGVPMGAPVFQYEAFCKKHGITVFSGNMALYRDMSSRGLKVLRRYSDVIEPYSIDENFFNLAIASLEDPEAYCCEIRKAILRKVGIPVSIGISTSKTLCKLGSEVAKEKGKRDPNASGVCLLKAMDAIRLFESLPPEEVWGIGWRMAATLKRYGINTVEKLLKKDEAWVRKYMSIRGVYTVRELRGISCFPLEEEEPPQKSMMVSASFGQRLKDYAPIKDAVVKHATEGAFRLRHAGLRAGSVGIHLRTSYFTQDVIVRDYAVPLDPPTSITDEIVEGAVKALDYVYRPNIEYAKAGIFFSEFEPADGGQMILEDLDPKRQKMNALMKAMDEINGTFGDKTIIPASVLDTSASDPHKGRLSEWNPEMVHIQLRERERKLLKEEQLLSNY
jgi:DNA polymerase V